MFKRGCLSLSVILFAAMPLLGQDKKPKDCAAVVSDDGQSFTCDKDHHVWKVSNPAVLQNMEGQHAKLTFRVNSSDQVLVLAASSIQEHTASANAATPR